mgnify:FL=1
MKKITNDPHTIEVPFASAPTRFRELLRNYTEFNKMGDIESGIHECFVTETDAPRLFFGGKKTLYSIICFHDDYLFWALIEDKKSDDVVCARWSELSAVTEWEDSQKAALADLHGVEIFGFLYMRSQRSTSFLALDKSVSGLKCRKMLKERIGNQQ